MCCCFIFLVNGYKLILSDNSPVIAGASVTLNAKVVDNKGECVKESLIFHYEDDAFPRHKLEVSIQNKNIQTQTKTKIF